MNNTSLSEPSFSYFVILHGLRITAEMKTSHLMTKIMESKGKVTASAIVQKEFECGPNNSSIENF